MTARMTLLQSLIRSAMPSVLGTDSDLKKRAMESVERRKDANGETAAFFTETNENIEQIIAGLKPEVDDSILAICGSGDQAFALAEYGARVYAVDSSATQIAFARYRAKLLDGGNAEMFLAHGKDYLSIDTVNYFARRPRLDAIRSNLDRVSFHVADVFNLPTELRQRYTKIYLSNAHQYVEKIWHKEMHDLTELLAPKGLLYAAIQVDQFDECCRMRLKGVTTQIIRLHEGNIWDPSVYRKLPDTQRERGRQEERREQACQGTVVDA
ncbi:TPA: class I SAM-dependent methyltransferase [Candidatus Woesearchaeota archaeon]|nr:class I SAM-dependent methyltransferase [Candidatus Woesearchaeota archaeon]